MSSRRGGRRRGVGRGSSEEVWRGATLWVWEFRLGGARGQRRLVDRPGSLGSSAILTLLPGANAPRAREHFNLVGRPAGKASSIRCSNIFNLPSTESNPYRRTRKCCLNRPSPFASPTGNGWNKVVLHNHLDHSKLLTPTGIRIARKGLLTFNYVVLPSCHKFGNILKKNRRKLISAIIHLFLTLGS